MVAFDLAVTTVENEKWIYQLRVKSCIATRELVTVQKIKSITRHQLRGYRVRRACQLLSRKKVSSTDPNWAGQNHSISVWRVISSRAWRPTKCRVPPKDDK